MNTLRRIERVAPRSPYLLSIHWKDGGDDLVDLSGVIENETVFAPLKDPDVFATAAVAD